MPEGDVRVQPGLVIPDAELQETTSRASGPGGQHVNKTSTRVSLRWLPAESEALSEAQRERLLRRLEARLTHAGALLIHADEYRSQSRNRDAARQRLAEIVREALHVPRNRRATKPSRSSKERGLAAKRARSVKKQLRRRPSRDD